MEKKTKVVALGLVMDDKSRVLITQRHDPKVANAHLLWDMPGGTNEFGEALENTVRREVFEETGVEVEVGELLPKCVTKTWQHDDFLQHTLVFCYQCTVRAVHPAPQDHKIAEVRWEESKNLHKYNFLPTTSEFIHLAFAQ